MASQSVFVVSTVGYNRFSTKYDRFERLKLQIYFRYLSECTFNLLEIDNGDKMRKMIKICNF